MKKICLLSILLTSCIMSYGQVKGFIGIQGGPHVNNALIDHTIYRTVMRVRPIPGYHGGMMLKLFTNQSKGSKINAGLQLGAIYSVKGWKQVFPTEEPAHRVKLGFLDIPIEAMAYFGKRKTKFFFTLGVFTHYLLHADLSEDPDLDNIAQDEFYTYREGRDSKFGYGARLSLGVQYESPVGTFHLDTHFSYAISDLIYSADLSEPRPDLSNLYTGGITVAYLIPFGKMDF